MNVEESKVENTNTRATIALVSNARYFEEFTSAGMEWLNRFGWNVKRCDDFSGTENCDGVIVVGISFFTHPPFRPAQFWVGVQSEQMPLMRDTDSSLRRKLARYAGLRQYYDLIVEWSPSNYTHYFPRSNLRFIPYGCRHDRWSDGEKRFDLSFVGHPYGSNGRRATILQKLKGRFQVCPTHELWGEEKYKLIHESKICLNLHQFESRSFESPRFFDLLSCGAFVASESIADSFPFQSGRDFVTFGSDDEMMEIIAHYLANRTERNAIAKSGYDVASQYTFAKTFEQLSLELRRLMSNPRSTTVKTLRCFHGHLANAKIEAVDRLAALKARIFRNTHRRLETGQTV